MSGRTPGAAVPRLYDERLGEALRYVAELFACRERKGSSQGPYVAHLLAVTALVLENGGSENEAVAAVLHDVLEDIEGVEPDDLARRFGAEVSAMVESLSDTREPSRKPPWRERKEQHLAHLRTASAAVQRIAVADKIHNAGTLLCDVERLGDRAYEPFNGGKAGTLWYYRAALEALPLAPPPLSARLRSIVEALERAG